MSRKTHICVCVSSHLFSTTRFNTLRARQNGRHFANDIFKCISVDGNFSISDKIWLKYVTYGLIHNVPVPIQVMAWCCSGNKPLSEPTLTYFTDVYMRHPASINMRPYMSSFRPNASRADGDESSATVASEWVYETHTIRYVCLVTSDGLLCINRIISENNGRCRREWHNKWHYTCPTSLSPCWYYAITPWGPFH